MSQFLSQSLSQQMRLEQRLTPQLIQSMAILQKPITDLEAYIESALESNAALELAEPEAKEPTTAQKNEAERSRESNGDPEGSFGRLANLAKDYDIDVNERAPLRTHRIDSSQDRDAKMGAMANTAGREIGFHENLHDQWSLLDLSDEVRRAGESLIDHLSPDGYLRVRFDEIADSVRPSLDHADIDAALEELHKLDPAGIGARDVVECLLLQVDRLPGDNRLERSLIENHLDDIAHNRLPAVAKATGCSIGEINEAMKAMRTSLCLHPGYLIGDRSVPVIRPDVLVEYADSGGGLTMRLARGNMPKLTLRDEVVTLAKSKKDGKETRDFARKHVEEASSLIDAVKFRQNRLLEVSQAIVERQQEFFNVGPEGLKVLRMSDLATDLGCDPSTISRTVAEKYMQTPRGIYPLRYFFTGGTETDEGESMGWDRVKVRVRDLIEEEDKTKPLNDDQIAAALKSEGIEISRRTVAKYRQQLEIPSARQRRVY